MSLSVRTLSKLAAAVVAFVGAFSLTAAAHADPNHLWGLPSFANNNGQFIFGASSAPVTITLDLRGHESDLSYLWARVGDALLERDKNPRQVNVVVKFADAAPPIAAVFAAAVDKGRAECVLRKMSRLTTSRTKDLNPSTDARFDSLYATANACDVAVDKALILNTSTQPARTQAPQERTLFIRTRVIAVSINDKLITANDSIAIKIAEALQPFPSDDLLRAQRTPFESRPMSPLLVGRVPLTANNDYEPLPPRGFIHPRSVESRLPSTPFIIGDPPNPKYVIDFYCPPDYTCFEAMRRLGTPKQTLVRWWPVDPTMLTTDAEASGLVDDVSLRRRVMCFVAKGTSGHLLLALASQSEQFRPADCDDALADDLLGRYTLGAIAAGVAYTPSVRINGQIIAGTVNTDILQRHLANAAIPPPLLRAISGTQFAPTPYISKE